MRTFLKFFSGLRGRVLMISGFMIVFLFIITLSSYRSITELNGTISILAKAQLPQMQVLGIIKSSSQAAPRNLWLALAYDADEGERAKYSDRTLTHLEMLKTNIGKIEMLNASTEQQRTMESLKKGVYELELKLPTIMGNLEKNNKELDALVRAELMTVIPPIAAQITEDVENLALIFEKANEEIVKKSANTYSFALIQTIVVSILACIIAVFISMILSSRLVQSFSGITNRVAQASVEVSSASQSLTGSSEQLATDAQSQASSIVQTSAAVTEITRMVDANVNASENATKMAEEIQGLSHKTKNLMGELSVAMKSILESNQRIENLVKIISEIGEKTEVIDDIVFKTQLLSFNASVEAERAGEHGRGFAVVAQEVGNLAQMSGRAATEIATIVRASIREADQVSSENKSRVQSGDVLALQTQEQMNTVIKKIEEVLSANKLIVTASREQLAGLQQVSSSMENLNHLTQRSANMSEATASNSEELKSQSSNLLDLVTELRKIVHGTDEMDSAVGLTENSPRNVSQRLSAGELKAQEVKARKLARSSELEERLKNWKVS